MANKPLLCTIAGVILLVAALVYSSIPPNAVVSSGLVDSLTSESSGESEAPTEVEDASQKTLPVLVEGEKIYLWDSDDNLPLGSFFSPVGTISSDGSCGEETWTFNSDGDGKASFAHNYNLKKTGELGRTTQGSVAASTVNGQLIFRDVEVVYWPEASGTSEGGPHSIHLRNEPDQALPFEITGQAQRIATIGSFKLNGIEYQMCS